MASLRQALIAVGLLVTWFALPVRGQTIKIPDNAPPEVRAKLEEAQRKAKRNNPSEGKTEEAKETKSDNEDKSDNDDNESNSEGPVKRPDTPPRVPDPRELEAKPNANGRVSFSFHGQSWPDVLQWLANVSELSLDWRELPSDYLNLTTQRSYTLAEARDLINRHLQARGYTLMLSGEVLSVFKLDAIDPSLAPRITEEELYDLQPHDIVKLSLELPKGIDVKQAVEDVKQALSKNAKVMPLTATKRLLMIDTVANLRMVSALLNAERLESESRVVPREFVLQHIQASSVIDTLYVVLGLDPNSQPSQMELRMQQQKLELMQQLARRGKDVTKLLKKDGPPVYLAYNRQRNSVLANAPAEQMRIIERTIDALDVPVGGEEESSADASTRTLKQYRLKSIKPPALISAVEEIGNLSPRAELRGDTASKTLFARANKSDHQKIQQLIDQLDGAETVVEVFWLRRLPAEAVAGSIESLIIQKPKKKKQNDYPFWSWRSRNNEPEEPDTLLRVDADIERNRLIVRGTPQQLEEVRDLLAKLGEPVGDDRGSGRRVRVLEALDPDETQELLKKLQQAWPSIGGETELIVPPTDPDQAPPKEAVPNEENETTVPRTALQTGTPFRLLANQQESAKPPSEKPSAPVTIQLDARGRIILSSNDTAALDRLEDLAQELAPAPERYHVFQVRERSAELLVDNLRVYFEEFLSDSDGEPILDWWGRIRGNEKKDDEPVRLSRRRPLRFLADEWSSSILVANATTAQLAEIGALIKAWDKQPENDRILTRRTATVKLRFAKASVVVSALKDVYRDLLSKGDREFDTEERKASTYSTRYLTRLQHGSTEATEPAGIAFGGLLSLGSDDEANVVVVSARQEVFESVLETIRDLDQQAEPNTTVRVVQLEGAMASDNLKDALEDALRVRSVTAGNNNQRERNNRGDPRRDRRRR